MAFPSPTLLGFWSYSREAAELGNVLHEAMQGSLRERLAPNCTVEIFRDTDQQSGIEHGHDWRRKIVRKIAGSALFFWLQSPRWLNSPVCLFELDIFRAQIERIAQHFSTPTTAIKPDHLFDCLLTPIRWANMGDQQWAALPLDTISRFQTLWNAAHIRTELNVANANPSRHNLHARCQAVGEAIRDDLFKALPSVPFNELLDFLAIDDDSFINAWLERFPVKAASSRF